MRKQLLGHRIAISELSKPRAVAFQVVLNGRTARLAMADMQDNRFQVISLFRSDRQVKSKNVRLHPVVRRKTGIPRV